MKCTRVRRELSAYIDGEVSPQMRRMIDEHLAQCPECDRHRQELVQTVEAVRHLAMIEPSAQFCANTVRRIRTAAKVPSSVAIGFRRWEMALVAALVLMISAIGWRVISRIAGTRSPDSGLSRDLGVVAGIISGSEELLLAAEPAYPGELNSGSVPVEELIRTLSDTEKDELKAALLEEVKGGYESNGKQTQT